MKIDRDYLASVISMVITTWIAFFLIMFLVCGCSTSKHTKKERNIELDETAKTTIVTENATIDTTRTTYNDINSQNKVVEETVVITLYDTSLSNNPVKAVIQKTKKEKEEREEERQFIEEKQVFNEETSNTSIEEDIDVTTEEETKEKREITSVDYGIIIFAVVLIGGSAIIIIKGL